MLWLGACAWAQPVGTKGAASATPPPQPVALRLLPPVLLRYRVRSSNFPWRLSAELLWQTDGRQYEASLMVRALGQERSQRSVGRIGPLGLEPARFVEVLRAPEVARFERARGVVVFEPFRPEAPLGQDTQDRLSVLPQLATLLASESSRYGPGARLRVPVASGHSVDAWSLSVAKAETLTLPGGEQPCVKLLREPDADNDQRLEIWLAPGLSYLPVRVLATEANGDQVDQQWEGHSTPAPWTGPAS